MYIKNIIIAANVLAPHNAVTAALGELWLGGEKVLTSLSI